MSCLGPTLYKGKCVRGREVEVIGCLACGYAHLHPKPDPGELERYYQEEYFQAEKPEYARDEDRLRCYQEQVYEEQVGDLPSTGLVLDVGCGVTAPFLKFVERYRPGWKRFGLDPALTPKEGFFNSWEALAEKGLSFHLINLSFVLEHLADPFKMLWKCREFLRDGGLLMAESPFDFSSLQNSIREKDESRPWWVSSPDHVNYFSPNSLKHLLDRCGLWTLCMGTTYPVELFLLHGTDYRNDENARRLVVERRADMQKFWRESGMSRNHAVGRTCWAVARKK